MQVKQNKNETVQNVLYIKNKSITFFSMYQILDYREEYIHHQVIQLDNNVSIEHARRSMLLRIMCEIDERHYVE